MQVLNRNEKSGMLRLYMDNDDDLWHLFNMIRGGDHIRGLTHRRDESQQDSIRSQKVGKRAMVLTIRVEKCEFSDFSSRLRVLGVITEGPQDHGCHHTINIVKGYKVDVLKQRWSHSDLERIRKAVEDAKKPAVVFLSIEDDNAVIAVLRQCGIEMLAEIRGDISGKFYKQKSRGKTAYFQEIMDKLNTVTDENTPLVIVGPGFAKEEFLRFASQDDPELVKRSSLKATGQAGLTGINEAMTEGVQHLCTRDARVLVETQEVDELLTEISKDGKVTYGEKFVRNALKIAAVEKLLVTDRFMREGAGEELVSKARETRAKTTVISTAHEGGKRLQALGGAAALLRFRIQEL